MKRQLFFTMVAGVFFVVIDAANAQTLVNAFSGTNTSPTVLSAEATILAGDTASGPIGPGWNGEVSLPLGLLYDLDLQIDGSAGTFSVNGSGIAGLLGSVVASKTFEGSTLQGNQVYQVSLGRMSSSDVSLLSNFTIEVGLDNGGVRTPFLNTSTGVGMDNIPLDVLSLFGTNDVVTFNFSTGNIVPTGNLYVEISTNTLASLANSNVTFTGLSLSPIPEPAAPVLAALGLAGLLLIRRVPQKLFKELHCKGCEDSDNGS